RLAEIAARAIGATGVTHDAEVAKVSVVGLGMRTHTGVATTMFEALAREGVNIQMITTSEIKISVLVDQASGVRALRALHKAFDLERPAIDTPTPYAPRRRTTLASARPATVENGASGGTSAGMEDLVISGVELDADQSRVTLFNVPDQPGVAARVFRRIAESGVLVDMIVQNVSTAGNTHLSFTVPCQHADEAAAAAALGEAGDVSVEPRMAKLSVTGVGIRTHTGVATRMFGALAEGGINIALINTSEVRINVATSPERGQDGLECLRRAFLLPANS
ncbi:MAG TPA: ACT domain-containing protein, partial [Isosphaeraceae bacterium]|nr:ACT domain-containing protein [Isosphaeraceae bacterium]